MMYIFNSNEWCYIKRATDNVLNFFLQAFSVKGKNGKYDCYIKRTTDNILQFCYKRLSEG